MRGYHPFLAWRRLADLGTQVKATVDAKDLKAPQLYACAARNKAGKLALLVARFPEREATLPAVNAAFSALWRLSEDLAGGTA